MKTGYDYQSDFAKKYFGEGIEEGMEKGMEKGTRAIVLRQLHRLGIEPDAALAEQLTRASLPTLERIADDLVGGVTDPEELLATIRRHLATRT